MNQVVTPDVGNTTDCGRGWLGPKQGSEQDAEAGEWLTAEDWGREGSKGSRS